MQVACVVGAAFVDVPDARKQEVTIGAAGDVHDIVGSHPAHVHFGHLAAKVAQGDIRTAGANPQPSVVVAGDGGDVLAGKMVAEFSVIDKCSAVGKVCKVAAAARTAPEVLVAVAQKSSDLGSSDGVEGGVNSCQILEVNELKACHVALLDGQHMTRNECAEHVVRLGNFGIEEVTQWGSADGAVVGVHNAESGMGENQGVECIERENIGYHRLDGRFPLVIELQVV